MTIRDLAKQFAAAPGRRALKRLVATLGTGEDADVPALNGLAGSSAAMMLNLLQTDTPPDGGDMILVIGADNDDAGYLYHDLSRICGDDEVAFFPSGFKRALKYGQFDEPSRILRTETLARITTADRLPRFVVTWPEALAERVASAEDLDKSTVSFVTGSEMDLAELARRLRETGFNQTDYVYEPGQFAIRGSIVDIFGYNSELPLRIDFFGDGIDTIRTFNVETQLSEEKLEHASVTADIARRTSGGRSLLDLVPSNAIIAVRGSTDVCARVRAVAASEISSSTAIAAREDGMSVADIRSQIVDAEAFAIAFRSRRRLVFSASNDKGTINFNCTPQAIYHKNFDLISQSFEKFLGEGYRIFILSDNPKQIERLRAIFDDRGDRFDFSSVDITLHEGFVDNPTKTCVFTDHQIFDRFHKYTLTSDRARSGRLALSLKELSSIEPGDYIVHIDHGIGKFAGLLRTNVNGHTQEMIKLVYQNDDIVFVSIHALHKLSKYRGKEGEPPRISKLGSGAWEKMKERTKTKLKDIARDLIRLYATRREQPGFAFSPDSFVQHQLEASFIYEDTPDQLTATQAVKHDMEQPKPMDRLICGDVGFGKTEIAIRAAVKAAADNKQTAVLVPTTVLAYQHFRTFSERLKDFPIRVEYLSRARSPKQAKEILSDLAAGKIDIIIGTHKLIGKTVRFHDLGLLVIDEEQKFGVSVKERLRQMKTSVDTLTLSATPIPRTLQFSLMGARDLSSITTPPPNRYPIVTSVSELSDELLLEAIQFELSRNGQIFIVNPRIEGLSRLESMVRRLVPDARVVIGHGQMPPEQLEKTIVDFANHDYDILLSTTIIESGVDMPNVNTIIINDAHRFGLSELHQLRGRVGRSSRKAFCYLMVPPDAQLTPEARRRLRAIESFSDLGSGIHIAMQDLDIRGAGNLLGAEQSGFIADLGYETYQKILREAMVELRTSEFPDLNSPDNTSQTATTEALPEKAEDTTPETDFVADTTVETDLELLLPADYVPGQSERISLYRQLDSLERDADLDAFEAQLVDRFGPLPEVASHLLLVPRLRRIARRLGIERVLLKDGRMYLYFVGQENKAYYQSKAFGRILTYLQMNPRRVSIRENTSRRSFIISQVPDVRTALDILRTIISLPSA